MAVADINEPLQHGRVGMETTGLQTLAVEVSKETIDDWKDSAAEYVRSQLFDKKQFVTDGELMMGGNIQMLVCQHINISRNERARKFWEECGGKETVRKTFRRKRQTAQNAMKIAFKGMTYNSDYLQVVAV
jgi:hypothetical protein